MTIGPRKFSCKTWCFNEMADVVSLSEEVEIFRFRCLTFKYVYAFVVNASMHAITFLVFYKSENSNSWRCSCNWYFWEVTLWQEFWILWNTEASVYPVEIFLARQRNVALLFSVVRMPLAEQHDPFGHTLPVGRRLGMAARDYQKSYSKNEIIHIIDLK